MALGGAGDLKDLRPVQHKRNVLGNHKQSSSHLNVENPQPGFSYRYEVAKRNHIRRRVHQGYEVVTGEHGERWGDQLDMDHGRALDSTMQSADVILMRIPHEKLREQRREHQRLAELALKGAETDYLDRGEKTRERLPGNHPNSLYYRRGDHN